MRDKSTLDTSQNTKMIIHLCNLFYIHDILLLNDLFPPSSMLQRNSTTAGHGNENNVMGKEV